MYSTSKVRDIYAILATCLRFEISYHLIFDIKHDMPAILTRVVYISTSLQFIFYFIMKLPAVVCRSAGVKFGFSKILLKHVFFRTLSIMYIQVQDYSISTPNYSQIGGVLLAWKNIERTYKFPPLRSDLSRGANKIITVDRLYRIWHEIQMTVV